MVTQLQAMKLSVSPDAKTFTSDQPVANGGSGDQVHTTQVFKLHKKFNEWLLMLDTGSAAHLTTDRAMLDPGSITKCNVEIVGIGGAKGAMHVKEKGKMTMMIGEKRYVLTNVLLAEGAHIYTPNNRKAYGPVSLLSIAG